MVALCVILDLLISAIEINKEVYAVQNRIYTRFLVSYNWWMRNINPFSFFVSIYIDRKMLRSFNFYQKDILLLHRL